MFLFRLDLLDCDVKRLFVVSVRRMGYRLARLAVFAQPLAGKCS